MPKTFIEYCTSWVNSIIWKVLHWLKKREFPSSANKNSCSRRKENVNILKARYCRLHAPCERGKWTEMHFLHNDEAGWCGPSVPRWFLCRASGFSANVTSLTLCSFAKSSWSLWHEAPSVFTRRSTDSDGEQHATGISAPFPRKPLALPKYCDFYDLLSSPLSIGANRVLQSSDLTSALKIKLVIHQGRLLRRGLCDDWHLIKKTKTLTHIAFPLFSFSTKAKGPTTRRSLKMRPISNDRLCGDS